MTPYFKADYRAEIKFQETFKLLYLRQIPIVPMTFSFMRFAIFLACLSSKIIRFPFIHANAIASASPESNISLRENTSKGLI